MREREEIKKEKKQQSGKFGHTQKDTANKYVTIENDNKKQKLGKENK